MALERILAEAVLAEAVGLGVHPSGNLQHCGADPRKGSSSPVVAPSDRTPLPSSLGWPMGSAGEVLVVPASVGAAWPPKVGAAFPAASILMPMLRPFFVWDRGEGPAPHS